MIKKKVFYWTVAIILLFSSGYVAWAAVSGETLINVQNPDYSVTAGSRVKDAGSISDNQTTGILPSGLMGHDGTNWDKVKSRNGIIFVNLTGSGDVTQSGTWFSNITGVNGSVRARQSGTWFSNITGINGSVRARQSGTWNVRQRNYTSLLTTSKPYQSSLTTAFSNNTTGAGSSINLGHLVSSHTWTIKSTKKTPDVNWTITLDGSLDNTDFDTLDTFTTRTSFNMRHIVNKPVEYVRGRVVQRGYTGTRPTITIKTKSVSGN